MIHFSNFHAPNCLIWFLSKPCVKQFVRQLYTDHKLYWLSIGAIVSESNIFKDKLLILGQNNLKEVSFSGGVGFVIVSHKSEVNKISLYKHLFRQSENDSYKSQIVLSELSFLSSPMISCGRDHALIYGRIKGREHPALISFGNNSFGQCGNGTLSLDASPKIVDFTNPIAKIHSGLDHSLIMTKNGKLFSCGSSTDGQTGLSTFDSVPEFREIVFPQSVSKIVKVSSCADTCLALTDDNRLFGWGNNEYGQILGFEDHIQINKPVEIHLGNVGSVDHILALGSLCAIVTGTNQIYVWGLGRIQGRTQYCQLPTEIKLIGNTGAIVHEKIIDVSGSLYYAILKSESGRIFTIGNFPIKRTENDFLVVNEIVIPRPVDKICCGTDGLFFTIQ